MNLLTLFRHLSRQDDICLEFTKELGEIKEQDIFKIICI